jgi:uncharacterized protein with ParB-like and HNH nuclease domain
MNNFFVPEQRTISEIFRRDTSYFIPEYQRPYSWDALGKSEKNNQINVMWEDLLGAFNLNEKEIYFFGSMVLIGKEGELQYTVIDGQQRLTSVALLFVAIKCFLQEQLGIVQDPGLSKAIEEIINSLDEILYNKKTFGGLTKDKKVKIEKNAGFDYDSVLKEVFECGNQINYEKEGATAEQITVTNRYFNNKNYFQKEIRNAFLGEKDKELNYEQALKVNSFFEFLKNKVSIVAIKTQNFDIAYHIFEILNNRGLQLSNKDLLRNFILNEFDSLKNSGDQYAEIVPFDKWQELDEDYGLDNEFISRFVESYNASQQKYSAFKDLSVIYQDTRYKDSKGKKRIELFYADLKFALQQYTKIVQVDFSNQDLKQKIKVILNAGNSRYSINFLMALFKYSKGEETAENIRLINLYEKRLWFAILHSRFSSANIYKIISALNVADVKKAEQLLSDFGAININTLLKQSINGDIFSNDTGKLLLAKYVWILESETIEDVVTQALNYNECSLEHIYPQSPQPGSNWLSNSFPQPFLYKSRLGNMTLVTHRLNSAMKNYDFKIKKGEYAKTKLAITHQLSELQESQMNEQYIADRQLKITEKILRNLQVI